MNKVLVGLIVGAVLGVVDGATAWFTPEVRSQMLSIIIGSTFKGIIAGVLAGWYARRVQSVPKGVAFGFIVGLVLAFAVAAMPSPEGTHYWWQIMVPGSILGGVIGWATQRYGRPAARTSAAAMMIAVLALSVGSDMYAHDHGAAKPSANASFEKLKSLAGTWEAAVLEPDGQKTKVEYRVTAGGSAVIETMFAGEPHEMVNVYTVDGDAIIATHYCSAQNQPTLKLNAERSTADRLVFDFVGVKGANQAVYINGMQIKFGEDGKVEEQWRTSNEEEHMRLFLNARR